MQQARRVAVAYQPGRQQPSKSFEAASDAEGKFEFKNVEAGAYMLHAKKAGFSDVTIGAPQAGKLVEQINVGPGEKKTDIVVHMSPLGVITGRVIDEDGDPVEGIQVEALTYRYTNVGRQLVSVRTALADDTGAYRIYNLPAGRYYLHAGGNPQAGYAAIFYPNAAESTGATPLELNAGQQLTGYNLTMHRGHVVTIRGRIIAPEDAQGLMIGYLVVRPNGSSSSTSNPRGPNGQFDITGVPPGPLYVIGSYQRGMQRFSTKVLVQVGNEDIEGLELRPIAPVEVSGQVRIEGRSASPEPLPKLSQVQIRLEGPGTSFGGTGDVANDGTLTIKGVEAGSFTVVPTLPSDLYLKSVHVGDRDITDGELDLSNGLPPHSELAIVLGADGGEVHGTVTDSDKNPVESCMVVLIPTGTHKSRLFYKVVASESDGHFRITGIAPGSYRMIAWDRADFNAVVYDPDFSRPYEAEMKSLTVRAGEKQELDLKLNINKEAQQ